MARHPSQRSTAGRAAQTFDGACAAAVTPLDLDGSAQMARPLFDRGDVWENDGD